MTASSSEPWADRVDRPARLLAELGSHAELLARGGEYAALWRAWHSG